MLHKRQDLVEFLHQCLTLDRTRWLVHALHRGLLRLSDLTSRHK
jgi:hypothetical protein